MKKRVLSMVLVLCMVLTLLPAITLSVNAGVSTNYTLTGNQANDIVAVATAQKGKTRSDFGWNDEWCAYFTCWAGRTAKADFPKSNIGNACDLAIWFLDNKKGSFYYFRDENYTSLKNNGLNNTSAPIKSSRSSFKPQKGDLICFLWKEDVGQWNWSHIGIVAENYSGSGNIKTIEGNTSGGVVAARSRAYDSTVIGFIRPNYKNTSNPNATPKLTISGVKAPSKLDVGESFPLRGIIKTDYGTITSVTASVTNANSKTVLTYTAKPKTTSYDINGPMDDAITFGKLSEGTYTYSVKATAVNGSKSTTSTLVSQNLVVGTPKYTVTYNANGGTGAPAKQTKQYGKDLTLSTTTPKKSFILTIDMNNPDLDYKIEKRTYTCKFDGWNTKSDGKGTNYASGAKYTQNANLTLYAKWTNPTVTMGVAVGSSTCFLGFYTAQEGGKKVESGFVLTSSMTIYGHWDKSSSATHNLGSWTVVREATCENDGLRTTTCENCGYVAEQKIYRMSHEWDYGKITKPATETQTGVKTYTCTRCGETKTETIPMLTHEHNYMATVTAPTCTEKGYTTHTCDCGDSYVDSYVDALGHNYKDGKCTVCGTADPNYKPPVKDYPFGDVKTDGSHKPYADAILWAADNAITTGYADGSFRPDNPCTRAQVVTFLWRAAGSPEPESDENPFADVSSDGALKPYYKAILWAVEQGITSGITKTHFAPNSPCTRAQFVTFLWRYEGKPDSSGGIGGFRDAGRIAAPYQSAVAWAVEEGVTTGYGDSSFRPNNACTRAQVVTFLYRDLK